MSFTTNKNTSEYLLCKNDESKMLQKRVASYRFLKSKMPQKGTLSKFLVQKYQQLKYLRFNRKFSLTSIGNV